MVQCCAYNAFRKASPCLVCGFFLILPKYLKEVNKYKLLWRNLRYTGQRNPLKLDGIDSHSKHTQYEGLIINYVKLISIESLFWGSDIGFEMNASKDIQKLVLTIKTICCSSNGTQSVISVNSTDIAQVSEDQLHRPVTGPI